MVIPLFPGYCQGRGDCGRKGMRAGGGAGVLRDLRAGRQPEERQRFRPRWPVALVLQELREKIKVKGNGEAGASYL